MCCSQFKLFCMPQRFAYCDRYKELIAELSDMKKQYEHVKHMIASSKMRMYKDFQMSAADDDPLPPITSTSLATSQQSRQTQSQLHSREASSAATTTSRPQTALRVSVPSGGTQTTLATPSVTSSAMPYSTSLAEQPKHRPGLWCSLAAWPSCHSMWRRISFFHHE